MNHLTSMQKAELLTNKSLAFIQKAHRTNNPNERKNLFCKAKGDAKAAQVLAPAWSRPHYRYARIHHINKKYKKAIENYDIVLALEPSYDSAKEYRAICVQELAKQEQITNDDESTKCEEIQNYKRFKKCGETPERDEIIQHKKTDIETITNNKAITNGKTMANNTTIDSRNVLNHNKNTIIIEDEICQFDEEDCIPITSVQDKVTQNVKQREERKFSMSKYKALPEDCQVEIGTTDTNAHEDRQPNTISEKGRDKYNELRRIEIITQERKNTRQIRESQKRQKREVHTSSRPLKIPEANFGEESFTPMAISDMNLYFDHIYNGGILSCTVLGPFSVLVGAYTIVEDSNGSVVRLGLYNFGFKSDEEFEVEFWIGQHISIKNPYLRIGMDNRPFIRVDNPATIVIHSHKRENVCSLCLGEGKKQCGECSALYCSTKCQEIDWRIYKHCYICGE
eukprot:Phypoly_transcript_03593.p1 GENE.Phypoly_transcript_03593~~Phypoly_transcript_03593.p1  ORF type:complete len:453 (+),score=65.57 Phypoly_transcript_03593:955-2313(+)